MSASRVRSLLMAHLRHHNLFPGGGPSALPSEVGAVWTSDSVHGPCTHAQAGTVTREARSPRAAAAATPIFLYLSQWIVALLSPMPGERLNLHLRGAYGVPIETLRYVSLDAAMYPLSDDNVPVMVAGRLCPRPLDLYR